ncbi:MAG: MFS transporter [Enhydrobacter sp.]|nr:MFS transporter [Enhydrobacter sp.]
MTPSPRTNRRSIAAGAIGNMLEWYDFAIYGYFAAQIGRTFFSSEDHVSQILAAFGIFAVGYLMRPLGGALIGYIGDRFGRPVALTLSITAMVVPTFLVGVLPGYHTLGIAAPVILTGLRMLQGLSVGGECPTSVVFLYEHAPPGRRGLCAAIAFCGSNAGILLGSATGGLVAALMTPDELDRWGWRIPFVVGLAIGVIGYFLRRHLSEPAPAAAAVRSPLVEVVRDHRPLLLWLAGVSVFGAVGFYLMFVYVVSWLQLADKIAPANALGINTFCMMGMIPIILATGWLSDKVGGRPLLAVTFVLGLIGAYPLLWLMHHQSLAMIVVGQLGFVVLVGLFFGALGGAMVEAAPPQVRCSATALGYNITFGIAGGLSPLVATWLVYRTGNDLSPAYMIMAAAFVSLLAMLLYRGRTSAA